MVVAAIPHMVSSLWGGLVYGIHQLFCALVGLTCVGYAAIGSDTHKFVHVLLFAISMLMILPVPLWFILRRAILVDLAGRELKWESDVASIGCEQLVRCRSSSADRHGAEFLLEVCVCVSH